MVGFVPIIQDEGVAVAGAPHTTLNFVGAGVTVTNAGGGIATITIPGGAASNLGSVVVWGAANINSAADTRVLPPGFDDSLVNTNTPRGFLAPRAGTMRNLFARHNIANGNGNPVVYTLRVNGILSALTVSLVTGAVGGAADITNSVAIAQGDLIEMVCSKAASIGSGVLDAMVSCQFN
jgi:hypothetical protein